MPELDDTINDLFARLDTKLQRDGKRDAIDEILASPPRGTAAPALADHETVRRFRDEVLNGYVRVDTARRLLSLIRVVVEVALA